MIPVPVEIKLTIIHNMYHTVHKQKPRKVQLCLLGCLSLHAEKYFFFSEIQNYSIKDVFLTEANVGAKSDVIRYEVRNTT